MTSSQARVHSRQPSRADRRWALALPLAAASALLAGCGGEPTAPVVVADSAGIRIVSNLGSDIPLEWRFEPAFSLGGRDSGPESFYDVSGTTVGADSAGNIYVLAAAEHRVVVFADDGRHLRTFGREGRGPGEIALPIGLFVRPDGTVFVDDLGKGRLVGFAPDGAPLDTEMPTLPGSPRVFWNGSHYSSLIWPDSTGVRHRLLVVSEADTTELAGFHVRVEDRVVELPSCGMSLAGMPPLFSLSIQWHAWRDRAAARIDRSYSIRLFEGRRLTGIVRRPIEPQVTTAELARREVGAAMTMMTSGGPLECDTDEVVERRGFEERMPAIRGLRVDPFARLWVSRAGPRPEPTPTDVIDADGTYLGTLPANAPYPLGFLPDGRLLVAETDDLDVTRLVVYGVEEVPSGFEPE